MEMLRLVPATRRVQALPSERETLTVHERILIIDDDPVVHEVVGQGLERQGYIVESAVDGAHGLFLSRSRAPALIVLDLGLPDMAGERVLQEVRRRSAVPILILSAKGKLEDRLHGLGLGADDYLSKPFSPIELVARVKAMLRRAAGAVATRDLWVFDGGRLEIDAARREVRVDGALRNVTRTEFNLILTLAQHEGAVRSRGEIAYELRGHSFDAEEGRVDERIVDVHIRNLRRKVEDDPRRPQRIQTVRGRGYRIGSEATAPGGAPPAGDPA
jgi:DNA-binding response OmpR family regulator